jgi:hypothetical protein
MNKLLLQIKKSYNYLIYPFIFISILLIAVNIINLFNFSDDFVSTNINLLFAIVVSYFVTYYECENAKKSIATSLSITVSDLIFYSISGVNFSLLLIIILSFLFSGLSKKLKLIYFYLVILISSIILSSLLSLIYPNLYDLLKLFANNFKGNGVLFGVINNFYSIAFSDNLEKLFYFTDYSTSVLINNKLITGVIDIFKSDINNPSIAVSEFLTGKYFISIFVTIGAFAFLFKKLNGNEKYAVLTLSLLSILFGDVRMLSLFIFLYNPVLYFCYLILIAISYLIPILLDIRIGYVDNATIVELFKYANNYFYFILSGVVIALLSYFVFRLVVLKYDFQSKVIYPKEVNYIVKALGGTENIITVSRNKVIVQNPNLINILNLDCEIHENEITLLYDDLQLLKEFF